MYECIFRYTFMYISIHAHIFIDTCVYIYDLYTYKHICIYIWIHKKQRCFHIDRCNGFSNGCPSVNWRGGVFEIGGWLHRWYCPYFDQYVCGHGRYASTRTHTHTHVHLCVCVCVYVCICTNIYMYIYIYIYMYVYIYIYICTRTRICMPCERPFISAKVLDISAKVPDIFAYEPYFFCVPQNWKITVLCHDFSCVCFPLIFLDRWNTGFIGEISEMNTQSTNQRYVAIAAVYFVVGTWQETARRCNTLQHTATHCNTLQHTATHCVTLH